MNWRSVMVALLLLVTGCTSDKLVVQTEYVTLANLASYQVNTPDPRQHCPSIGQRMIVFWSLHEDFSHYKNIDLWITVRFRNREIDEVKIPIEKPSGTYLYCVLNDRFFETQGILTYKVEVWGDDQLLEEWHHQIWSDVISFDNPEPTEVEAAPE